MAGFFGLFDYTKPGKGVRKDEPKKSHFVQFFILLQRKFWKIIQLNLIYLLFCIPVVTIGPATAGMTYVLRQFATERPVFLFSDFWDNFKANWKQSFVYSVLFSVTTIILVTSLRFYFLNAPTYNWMYIPIGLCFLVALLILMANLYIYLMIVTLDLPLRSIIKNGFLLGILCLKSNVVTLLILALLLILSYLFFPFTIFFYLFIGFALISFIICFNAYPGVKKFAIDPYVASLDGQKDVEDQDSQGGDTLFQDEYMLPRTGEE